MTTTRNKSTKTSEVFQRDSTLDKAEYPARGYYWVPAGADSNLITVKVAHQPVSRADKPKLLVRRREVDNIVYYYSSTGLNRVVATAGPIEFLKGKYANVAHVGKDFLSETIFSLYGVADAPKTIYSRVRHKIRKLTHVIQDSGGFQLATGVKEFIDPLDVAKFHSLYADSGVALDIPSSGLSDTKLVLASARMLVANNKIMREHTDPAVKLMNVCHGINLQTRSDYLKIILKGEKLDSLCVGGLRRPAAGGSFDPGRHSPSGFISHVLLAMLMTEKHYYHYHILGVASDWQMALLALVSYKHQKLVTSDSATHLLMAKSGLLINYGAPTTLGHKMGRRLDEFTSVRCNCPVCVLVNQEVVYRIGFGPLSAVHNGYALARRGLMYDSLMTTYGHLDAKELTQIILDNTSFKHTSSYSEIRDFYKAVSLIYETTSYKDLSFVTSSTKTSLFAEKASSKKNAGEAHVAALLRKYEEYHGQSFFK